MTSLSEIQQLVRDAVFESQADGPALRAITNHINASTGFSSTEHLLIYRRAILGTLVRAIGNIFPVCKKLVGEEFFDGMARIYARKTPSRSPDLADYGESFADFIAEFDPAASLPYLPDVARLEWHWHRAFNAADETGIDIKALGDVDDEVMDQIILKLPVSASLLRSAFPIHHIWQVNQSDWEGEQTVDLHEGSVNLIIWRRQYEMRIDELDDQAWSLLKGIEQGLSLGELSGSADITELDLTLPKCVQTGWIAGFTPHIS